MIFKVFLLIFKYTLNLAFSVNVRVQNMIKALQKMNLSNWQFSHRVFNIRKISKLSICKVYVIDTNLEPIVRASGEN